MDIAGTEPDASSSKPDHPPSSSPPPVELSIGEKEQAELRARFKEKVYLEYQEQLKDVCESFAEMSKKVERDIEKNENFRRRVVKIHRDNVEFGGGCFLGGLLLGMAICISWEEWVRRG
ncbi:hypothetical protein DOTSEDRAFT_28334 [Dothistroma septosporum NZE10]|uniref:Uncharacterized protein n=1 Tax=Dothistroma septosporum (strain NZE10 / CBS 128990) TaxID=675120 RepID=M2XI56_DOTSN|nr:hypothetical protein DOTSEDRAFT_28334 [Dothistroma septosporum NZE10]